MKTSELLIKKLSRVLELPLTFSNQAVSFVQDDGSHWQIEFTSDNKSMLVHSSLKPTRELSHNELQRLLALNTYQELLSGAYIGLCEKTQRIKLLYRCEITTLDIAELPEILGKLMEVRTNLKQRIQRESAYNTSPQHMDIHRQLQAQSAGHRFLRAGA